MGAKYQGLKGRKIILSLVLVAAMLIALIILLITRQDIAIEGIFAILGVFGTPLGVLVNGITQHDSNLPEDKSKKGK